MKFKKIYPPCRIIIDEPGQMCNRFWSYLDSIAWAIRNNKKVYILLFDKSIVDYNNLRNNKYVSFPFYNKTIIDKIGYDKYISIIRKIIPRNKVIAKLLYLNKRLNLFHYGWELRYDNYYFPSCYKEIQYLFLPNKKIQREVESLIQKYKNKTNSCIIGVHIRRGDYKTFWNGRFYYDYNEYITWMTECINVYNNKNVYFYISSNENIPIELFDKFNLINTTNQSAAFDLYALSLCDRIIGPISTFSRWASFIGNVPLCFLFKKTKIKSDDVFSPIKDYSHYSNGKEIISLVNLYWRAKAFGISVRL